MLEGGFGLVAFGIVALAVSVLALIVVAVQRESPRGSRRALWIALGTGAWLAVSAALALSGFLARFELWPPPFALIVAPTLGLPLLLAFSRLGSSLAQGLPLAALIAFHGFRLPLELVMHEAAKIGLMPDQMTFTGWNFDIITGVTALLVAGVVALGRAPRWLVLAWNALGSALLFAIIAIAIASLPRFHAFGSEPARLNTWVAYFPYVWLPAALVAAAVLGHALLWRRLLRL